MIESLFLSLSVARRNWVVYRKDLIANMSPSICDPIFMMFSFGMGLGTFIPEVEGMSYLKYIAPGLVGSAALVTSFFETSYGFYVRLTFENIYKAMLTTPIGPDEVVWGEFIWVAAKGVMMSFLTAGVFVCFGLFENLALFPLLAVVGILIGLSCGAIGLISSCFISNINQFQTIYSFIISPIFFFSGIFYPFEKMPTVIQWISGALPFSHGVVLAQQIFWNRGVGEAFLVHGTILVGHCLLLCGIARHLMLKKLRN